MNVAFRLLRHLGRNTSVNTEQHDTSKSGKKGDNGVYTPADGYRVLISTLCHRPRDIGSFKTTIEASKAYEMEYAKIRQQCFKDTPGKKRQHDTINHVAVQQHHQSPSYERDHKRPCTAATYNPEKDKSRIRAFMQHRY